MTTLPLTATWAQHPDHLALAQVLGAEHIRWVGGAVRDSILGREVSDIDAATTHTPEEVMRLCAAAHLRTIPTGLAHGTVTVLLPSCKVEVTTLRKDVATDGRHATVEFSREWREDAARRDFTINALYAHPETLEISDYFGGLEDLAAARVRFIGDARTRIHEDHLRILRYYRFQARFGAPLDEEAEEACQELAPCLKGLSRERISGELLQILALPAPHNVINRMFAGGVLPIILPECGAEGVALLEKLEAREKQAGIAPSPLRRLAALIPADEKTADKVALHLRMSRKMQNALVCLAARGAEDAANPRALAYRVGKDNALARVLLMGGDVSAFVAWEVPQFPLKGGDIIARAAVLGREVRGAAVSDLLRVVEGRWIEATFPVGDGLAAILDAEIANL